MNRPPQLPGLLGEMSIDLQESGLAHGLINLNLIANASLLAQGVADVEGPMGNSPVGVACAGVYPSGAGKSSVAKQVLEPIAEVLATMPSSMHGFLLEDATREAVVESMKDCPVAGLMTDEGGQLERMLGTSAPTFAKLMDGTDIRHARVGNKTKQDQDLRVSIENPRFTALLLMQPDVFEKRLKTKLGAGEGGQGLANRFHWDDSPPARLNHSRSLALQERIQIAYRTRIETLLRMTYENMNLERKRRPVLRLSPEAQAQYRVLRAAEFPGAATEYAVRHAQRTLRLAAALHVFEYGPSGDISLEELQVAEAFDQASIASFTRLSAVPVKLTQAQIDAQVLIEEFSRWAPNSSFKVTDVRRHAPNLGMTKSRFDHALPLICGAGLALVYIHEDFEYIQVSSRLWWNQAMPTYGSISLK
jgi:hypothetical protein